MTWKKITNSSIIEKFVNENNQFFVKYKKRNGKIIAVSLFENGFSPKGFEIRLNEDYCSFGVFDEKGRRITKIFIGKTNEFLSFLEKKLGFMK